MKHITNVPHVSIAGIQINTDGEGRFNLNALHKASKLGADKAPAQWLRNKQAKQLIEELERETVQICIVSEEGRNGGTFAHELLAVSYAGWISPSFQLKVNQVFLDYKKGALPDYGRNVVHLDKSARETRLFMRQALQIANLAGLTGNQRLIAANRSTRKATGFDYLAEMGVPHLAAPQNDTLINATTIGEKLGAVSAMRVNHLLAEHGFQTGDKDAKGRTYWVPTEKGIAAGGVMTDVERSNKTGQARHLKWASSIVNVLRGIIGSEAA